MITISQILRYKVRNKIARISITRNNYIKLHYSDCSSSYVTIPKFIEMVTSDECEAV